MRDYIDAAAFKEMILCANAALHANTQAINDLNVFPVPDGDTGTNMGLTMTNAATELRKKDFDTIADAASCVSGALLRGARGNSGVILSLLFRGIAQRLKGLETAGAAEFTGAMVDGVTAAYKAVMKPAEGTILTVSRLASAAAAEAAEQGLERSLERAIEAGEEALADTVNQNPVLKKAGVIDAGGKGYMVILSTMLASLRGEVSSETLSEPAAAEEKKPAGTFTEEKVEVPEQNIFDTVFTVRKKDPNVDFSAFVSYLDSIGDSLVVNDDEEIIKVHVHTDIPGDVLAESVKYGHLELAKIENMYLQAIDKLGGRREKSTDDLYGIEEELEAQEQGEEPEAEPEKEYGVVAVCAGKGMEELFLNNLGADNVVTGGQTMNPSTDDILRAVRRTPASTVFVFPNNKNIIMAAEQCVGLTKKKVIVIPTKTVPQGVTALLNLNVDDTEQQNVANMTEAIGQVHTAMVTYAARDSEFDGRSIKAGEHLALIDGALLNSYPDVDSLMKDLGNAAERFSPEFITIYYGADVQPEDADDASAVLKARFPDAELSIVSGGQPVYYYMIAFE